MPGLSVYLAVLCDSSCVIFLMSAFPWFPAKIACSLFSEGTRVGTPVPAAHQHQLAPAHSWERTWICFLPLSRTDRASAGHSLRLHDLAEAGGYWDWSERIEGSFHGGVLSAAGAQGLPHCQLIVLYSVWQRALELRIQGSRALHTRLSSQCCILRSPLRVSLDTWYRRGPQEFPSLLWGPWIFYKR